MSGALAFNAIGVEAANESLPAICQIGVAHVWGG